MRNRINGRKDMANFFNYVTDYPPGNGFEMFGFIHIMWLVVIVIISIIISIIYSLLSKQNKEKKMRLCIGIIMPVISLYRDLVLLITGHFDRFYLPLHLCGMALFIGSIYCFTKWRFVGVIYVLLCVPGALGALLFPDWIDYPLWNYMHIHDFISHGLIVAWGICLLASGELIPKWKELWMPVVFGICGVGILYPVNNLLGTNYWFLNGPSPGSPLESVFGITGKNLYIPGYIMFVMVLVIIWMGIIKGLCYLSKKN